MDARLLVSDTPKRSLAIRTVPTETNKKSQYVLVLEQVGSSGSPTSSSGNVNCTARFQPTTSFDSSSFTPLLTQPIKGCLGLIQVDEEPYLCVITECTPVGQLEGSSGIYQINNVMFFALNTSKYDAIAENGAAYVIRREYTSSAYGTSLDSPTAEEAQFEVAKHPCQNLYRLLSSGSFYFSSNFDLTRTAQVRLQSAEAGGSIWDTADQRFFWNYHIIRELLKFRKQLPENEQPLLDQQGMLVMATSGFVRIDDDVLNHAARGDVKNAVKVAIISRLSCKRAGTRFNTRGVDDDGNVANNVETEVLVYAQDLCYSYVEVRGSVPVFWEQQGLQLGKHTIQITRSAAATQPAVERHFRELTTLYGKQHIVNLLSQKEGTAELLLTDTFHQHVRNLEGLEGLVEMTNFDFHEAVKGNKFENLEALVQHLRGSVKDFGYFLFNMTSKQAISTQQGAFRVNCLDCLDRTNVVQGLLCKANLNTFCTAVLKTSSENLFAACLNDIWADNGDALSRIYTGTGALKSGFTRTGKRTIAGFMDDARKSASRFIQNNFQDKSKQEVIDLLLGKLANQKQIRLHNPVREAVLAALESRSAEYCSKASIHVHVATWNVNGRQPLGESLVPWLTFNSTTSCSVNALSPILLCITLIATRSPPEIYAIGFQEIVELSPQQIMATDKNKRLVWEDVVLKTLNAGSQQYVLLRSEQLVGAAICIFVRSDMIAQIKYVDSAIKKTGLAGLAGNKGGVAIRMQIYDSSLCFVCAHFAAGHGNVQDRDRDYHTITDGLMFKKGRRIPDHDSVIWFGDFNYRINLGNDEVRSRVQKQDYSTLMTHDQLMNQMNGQEVFSGFSEGTLAFAPTYKYDNGTNNYDTSEKNRIPAWTDRVLFFGSSIKQLGYQRAEMISSDHKPVKALFQIELRIENEGAKTKIQQELYKKFTVELSNQKILVSAASGAPLEKSRAIAKSGTLIDFGAAAAESATSAATTSKPTANPSFNWWDDGTNELGNNFQKMSISPSPTRTSDNPPPLPQRPSYIPAPAQTSPNSLQPFAFLQPPNPSASTNISAANSPAPAPKPAFIVSAAQQLSVTPSGSALHSRTNSFELGSRNTVPSPIPSGPAFTYQSATPSPLTRPNVPPVPQIQQPSLQPVGTSVAANADFFEAVSAVSSAKSSMANVAPITSQPTLRKPPVPVMGNSRNSGNASASPSKPLVEPFGDQFRIGGK